MSRQSQSSADLYLLDELADFIEHADRMSQAGRRSIRILSTDLDRPLYHRETFTSALSQLARSHALAEIQILLVNTSAIVEHGHSVLRLAQRLPSKFNIKKLSEQADAPEFGFMMVDSDKLLYKNDDSVFSGFANYAAGPEVKHHMDLWQTLWRSASEDPQLRRLNV